VLMDAIEGDLRIRTTHATQMKAWSLDINGKRGAAIDLPHSRDTVTLVMKQSCYYELSVR
jgi:hypothetical protein